MVQKHFEIVSLGLNCLPRTILTRGGIKPRKAEGELTCPFDLSVNFLENVVKAIKADFKGYTDDVYFRRYKRFFLDFRGKGYWEKQDGTCFVHDKNCKTLEEITLRIDNRIKNWRTIIDSELPILFVLFVRYPEDREYVNELYDVLVQKINNRKKMILSVIDFNGIESLNYNHEIKVLNLPAPIKNYGMNWIRTKFTKSALGKYIDKCVCGFIQTIIDEEFKRGE